MRVISLVRWERSKFDFLFSCTQLIFRSLTFRNHRHRCILANFLLNLRPCLESISLQFNKHFLLHQVAVFISHLIVSFLKDNMTVSQFFQIIVKLLLFLLYSLVMHLIKVFFLKQFLISASCLFSYDNGFVQLIF